MLAICAFDLVSIAKLKFPVMRSELGNIETGEGTSIIYVPIRFRSLRAFSILLEYPEVSVAGEVYFTARRSSVEIQEILLEKRGYDVQLKWTSVAVPIVTPPRKWRLEAYYLLTKWEAKNQERNEVLKESCKEEDSCLEDLSKEEQERLKKEMEQSWEKEKEEYRINVEKRQHEVEEQRRKEENIHMTDEERKRRIESWREDIRRDKEEERVYWIGERSYRTRIK